MNSTFLKNNLIWKPASLEQFAWVQRFKEIFILQKKDSLHTIFDIPHFGLHNAFSMQEYANYEFEEFHLKCDKFSLTMEATIECYQLKDNFFYFSLGKKNDKAVFEAIFRWSSDTNLALGNGYQFKIEPKTQFIKKHDLTLDVVRRINITPKDLKINAIIQKEPGEDFVFNKIELPLYLGGNFYNIQYQRLNDDSNSFWDTLKIATNKGIVNHTALMRGKDHPLFIDNLFPIIHNSYLFSIEKNIFPVVVYVLFQNGEEEYFKYPLNNVWEFNNPIAKVCLTDTLSFDWIVENPY